MRLYTVVPGFLPLQNSPKQKGLDWASQERRKNGVIEEVDRDGRRLIDVGMNLVSSSSCIDGGVFGGDGFGRVVG